MLLGFTLAQRAIFCPENEDNKNERSRPRILSEVRSPTTYHKLIWLVVSTPLKNISQLGLVFPIDGKTTCSKPPISKYMQYPTIHVVGLLWLIFGSPLPR
jgi:hypothetical protein